MKQINKKRQEQLLKGEIALHIEIGYLIGDLRLIVNDESYNVKYQFVYFKDSKINSSNFITIKAYPISYFFEEEREFVLPEKWNINVKTREQAIKVIEYINHIHKDRFKNYHNDTGIYYIRFDKNVALNCSYNHWRSEHYPIEEEITFEQFKKYVMKEEQEIIGYECPMDLFGGEIKKGEIFYKGNAYWYMRESGLITDERYALPAEIVETWKPIYKEKEEPIMLGDKVVEFKGDGCFVVNGITFGGGAATAIKDILHLAYCSSVKWHGEDVTLDKINKIIERLNK